MSNSEKIDTGPPSGGTLWTTRAVRGADSTAQLPGLDEMVAAAKLGARDEDAWVAEQTRPFRTPVTDETLNRSTD